MSDLEFPLLTQTSTQSGNASKPSTVSAASLFAISKAARSSTNVYKTSSPPIDRIVGPFLRRGFGLQISGPPGACIEQLLLGLVKNVTSTGQEVVLVDMQNKIKAETIHRTLEGDDRTERVHYCMLHKLSEVVEFLATLPKFLSEHPNVSLLVLSSLSFPFLAENNYATRNASLDRARESIVKLCKQHNLVSVITTTMSTHFVKPDGSRGTFGDDTKGIMCPQIDFSCKAISSLILSRDDRKSGRAFFTSTTSHATVRAEFDFVGPELRDKVP